jgi:hypothetical protein
MYVAPSDRAPRHDESVQQNREAPGVLEQLRVQVRSVDVGSRQVWLWELIDDAGCVHASSTRTSVTVDCGLYAAKQLAMARGQIALAQYERTAWRRTSMM